MTDQVRCARQALGAHDKGILLCSIAHFDHMASFCFLTFHLLAHEFVASLHLTIMGFSLAYRLPSELIL